MESQICVRDAQDADFTQWRTLWDQYNAFYGRKGSTALAKDIVLSTWRRFLAPHEPMTCLVAEQDNRLVGLAHFIFHRNTIMIENTAYLQDLYSAPLVRGKGVGRALISAFYERSRDMGVMQVYWHTHSSNHTAKKLYDRMATNTDFVVYRRSLLD